MLQPLHKHNRLRWLEPRWVIAFQTLHNGKVSQKVDKERLRQPICAVVTATHFEILVTERLLTDKEQPGRSDKIPQGPRLAGTCCSCDGGFAEILGRARLHGERYIVCDDAESSEGRKQPSVSAQSGGFRSLGPLDGPIISIIVLLELQLLGLIVVHGFCWKFDNARRRKRDLTFCLTPSEIS